MANYLWLVFLLILLFLLLKDSTKTGNVLNALAAGNAKGIEVLQGRFAATNAIGSGV